MQPLIEYNFPLLNGYLYFSMEGKIEDEDVEDVLLWIDLIKKRFKRKWDNSRLYAGLEERMFVLLDCEE